MNLSELYKEYGEAMIRLEIIQSTVNNLKQKIADQLNLGSLPAVSEIVSPNKKVTK